MCVHWKGSMYFLYIHYSKVHNCLNPERLLKVKSSVKERDAVFLFFFVFMFSTSIWFTCCHWTLYVGYMSQFSNVSHHHIISVTFCQQQPDHRWAADCYRLKLWVHDLSKVKFLRSNKGCKHSVKKHLFLNKLKSCLIKSTGWEQEKH